MCRMTQYLFIKKNQLVFDIDSLGDLFYIVISGKVSCKIPFKKQLIYISPDERYLFNIEFKKDIIQFHEADEINKK